MKVLKWTKSTILLLSVVTLVSTQNNRYYDENSIYSRPPNPAPSYNSIPMRYGPKSSNSACYDRFNNPTRCTPEFVNAAYNAPVEATNTCGINGASQYCMQTGATGSNKKTCEYCDASNPALRHPPEFLVDYSEQSELTWWQSESLFEGKWPKQINLTLHLGKTFEITYVRLRFHSPRAESFAIYKKTLDDGEWIPFQFYSSNCAKTYSDRIISSPNEETQALCTKEFSDISPLTGGNVVFTTLEGRANANIFDHNERLQEFVTATEIRIVLDNMNTFGDEIFGDEQVLRSYYYAISDLSVGGICKCNGHANRCVPVPYDPNSRRRLMCQCEHNTAGPDCEKCLPFFNDQPWRRATAKNAYACQACNCNSRSNKCYFDEPLWRKTGHGGHCIDCADNTDGPNCEKCKENYYLDTITDKCVACNCDPTGSISLQCSGNGQCACKNGVDGKQCDRCAANYFDFGHNGCRPCGCVVAGSAGNVASCDKTGKCMCKKNVEGEKCDRCKPGFFDLQWSNDFGCVSCFCFGHANICTRSTGYSLQLIESSFNRDLERWIAKDKRGSDVAIQYNSLGRNIGASSMYQDNPVYFIAPEKFLGDKKYSYNRNLSFSLQVNGDNPISALDDIVIEGNGIRISTPIFGQNNPFPTGQRNYYSFRLHEDFSYGWTPPLDANDFLSLLSNITSIKIKSTYTTSGSGSLDDVTLETAVQAPGMESEEATWVETCTCPTGYDGQHCESCAAGYKHDPPRGGKFAKCVPCVCNNHGEYCDSESGRCICNHNTGGDTCDRCAPGYYGNALNQTENDCKPCPCPDGGECTILPDETVACLSCPDGYGGHLCDKCVDGFHMNKDKCERCECNGNIDTNAVGNCNMLDGKCLKCIFNTWGNSCEKCLPGYYGSALAYPKGDCKSCGCNSFGTFAEENFNDFNEAKRLGYMRSYMTTANFLGCNVVTGQCNCKPNVAGRQCNACVDGYWDITSNEGCKACNCDSVGSLNRLCDDKTGLCNCRPGITGQHCDKCLPDHYGFSTEGCHKCECDPIGSESSQCDLETGQCKCRPNVEGKRCEFCMENKYKKEAGCLDCPACYTLVQESVASHRTKVAELKSLLDEIEQNPYAVEDANFEKQLNEVMNTVRQLLQDAKDAQGVDDSLVFQLEQIKSRIRKVQDTTKKINSQLEFISVHINYGTKNISIADDITKSAENDLNNARNYLENDGKRSLEKARIRSERYGQQSEKMTEIARESRLLADDHERNAEKIIATYKEARNVSETAYNLAKDAINTQKANREELEKLKDKLNEVKDQWQMTLKLSEDVHKDAIKAEEDSLILFTDVSNIKVPDLDSARYKAEAQSIIAQAKSANKDANDILNSHEDLLNSTGSRLKDARTLFQDAERQQQIADRLLAEVEDAVNQTNQAIKVGENILDDAKNTLKTLKEFDQNVQASKDKAKEALGRIPTIQADIENASKQTESARNTLQQALSEAINARDIAKMAENRAQAASMEARKIRDDALETKNKVNELIKRAQNLLSDVARTSDRMKNYENQAAEDEKLVQDALELANTAKTSAVDANQKVINATRAVDDILRDLNSMDDMDEKYLFELENRLRDAEKDLKGTDLDSRVNQLEMLNKEQTKWIKDYEDEVNKLSADVANIAKIRESLPDGCFRRLHLEP